MGIEIELQDLNIASELDMQELEAMEAPGGWATTTGIATGISIVSIAASIT
ncbi:daptide-type RiPP [Streptomyces sp. URMC 123]|uniref:daptide-type RiPP n=1 Tax=Streptomyces sp. URMC 123 TaxID=3423403 RepID=UPI003F1A1C20